MMHRVQRLAAKALGSLVFSAIMTSMCAVVAIAGHREAVRAVRELTAPVSVRLFASMAQRPNSLQLRGCPPQGLDEGIAWIATAMTLIGISLFVYLACRLRSWTAIVTGLAVGFLAFLGMVTLGPLDVVIERQCLSSCHLGRLSGCCEIARAESSHAGLTAICEQHGMAACAALAIRGSSDENRQRACDLLSREYRVHGPAILAPEGAFESELLVEIASDSCPALGCAVPGNECNPAPGSSGEGTPGGP